MRLQLWGGLLATLVLSPALANGQGRWVVAKCDIKPGHYLVNSAVLYLKNAAETRFDDQREKDLRDAQRTLVQAVTTGGQDKNPAAWYYLARYYLIRNDADGADSAFRRTEALMPTCHEDILFWRRNSLWVPAFNAGVTALNAQSYDSAIFYFRRAIMVFDAEPQTYTTLATTYFNAGQPDSAAKFFHLAVEHASDPKDSVVRKEATFNLGNSFYVAHQFDSAAAAYAAYLRTAPNDIQALTRLGDVLAAGGHKDSAMSIYRQIVAHADTVDPVSLINTGVSIYNAAPPWPDTAVMSNTCRTERRAGRTLTPVQRRRDVVQCDSIAAQAMKDRNAAAAVNYQLAAQAFEAGLQHAPQSRDGLYNLSNTYLALRQPDKMLAVAQRLVVIDPLSRNSLRLVAQAWQLKGVGDSALHYVILADSLLPVDISIGNFNPGEQNVTISGLVTNYHERPSAALKVTFEFLNAAGTPVVSQSLDVPTLDANGTHPFQLQAIGAGVVAWRYHKE